MPETLTKLDNLCKIEQVLELSSLVIHAGVQRRDQEQKKFCGNKNQHRLLNTWRFDNLFSAR